MQRLWVKLITVISYRDSGSLVKLVDESGLAELGQNGLVDEGFRLRRFCSGMGREIEHRLHSRRWHEGESFPCRQKRLIGILQVIRVGGLGIFADDLLGVSGIRPGDFDAFEISLQEPAYVVGARFYVIFGAGQRGVAGRCRSSVFSCQWNRLGGDSRPVFCVKRSV